MSTLKTTRTAIESLVDSTLLIRRASMSSEPVLDALFALSEFMVEPEARQTLSRFTRDKLRARFPAGSGERASADFVGGLRFTVDTGDLFGAQFYLGYVNERQDVEAVINALPDGGAVVDVGANFGLYTVYAGVKMGRAGRVVAFEPLPSAFELLEQNVADNELGDRVTTVRAAVADKPGAARFHVAQDGSFSGLRDTRRSERQETISVDVVTVDASPDVAALERVDLLKIDVEGGEADVLQGAMALLERERGVVVSIEYSHKNLTGRARTRLIKQLKSMEAMGFVLRQPTGEGLEALAARDIAASFSGNLFAWREESAMGARLLTQYAVMGPPNVSADTVAPAVDALLRKLSADHASQHALDRASALLSEADSAGETGGDTIDASVERLVDRLRAAQRDLLSREKSADTWRSSHADAVAAVERNEAELQTARDALAAARALAEEHHALAQSKDELVERLRAQVSDLVARLEAVGAEREGDHNRARELNARLEKFSGALESSEALIATLRRDNAAMTERLAEADDRLREHQNNASQQRARADTAEAGRAALADKTQALETALNDANALVGVLRQDVVTLKEQAATARAAHDATSERVDRERDRANAFSAALDKSDALAAQLRSDVDSMRDRLNEAVAVRDQNARAASEALTELTELRAIAAVDQARLRELTDTLSTLEAQVAAATSRAEQEDNRAGAFKTALEKKEATLAATRADVADLRARLETSNAQRDEQLEALKAQDHKVAAVERDLVRARDAIDAATAAKDAVLAQLDASERTSAEREALAKGLTDQVEALKRQLVAGQTDVDALRDDVAATRARAADLDAALARSASEVETLRATVERTQSERDALIAQREELQGTIAAIMQEVDRLKSDAALKDLKYETLLRRLGPLRALFKRSDF